MPSALSLKDAKTITKIPVLPISYADAQPLLAALKGEVVPDGWRGSLPQTYHLGPGAGQSSPQSAIQLGPQAGLRRHRKNSRRHQSR